MHTLLEERSLQLRTLIYGLWFSLELIYIFSTGTVGGEKQQPSERWLASIVCHSCIIAPWYIVSLQDTPTFAVPYCVISS